MKQERVEQQVVRGMGLCGELVEDGAKVCILPKGHREEHPGMLSEFGAGKAAGIAEERAAVMAFLMHVDPMVAEDIKQGEHRK